MGKPFIALDKPGTKGLAIGNGAIARGAFEAGVILGSGYPGTPSTEILEIFTNIITLYPEYKINVEWSINEKVGYEVAYGGSMCNGRSLATMKHVGLNVASDSFLTTAYAGAKGGFVVITADDPSMHSSQNEQDNRFYGMQALVPVFEPATVQDAKDMMKYAFEFSEKFETVVLFRTTTRINHGRGDLELGPINYPDRNYKFDEEQQAKWANYPSNARQNRLRLLERYKKIAAFAEEFPFNEKVIHPNSKVGIISSGIPYSHTLDVLEMLNMRDKVSVFKLGLVFPLPKQQLTDFMKQHETIIIVEELEPFLEQLIKEIAFDEKISVKIHGKDIIPQIGELYPEILLDRMATFFRVENPITPSDISDVMAAPPRPPVLCAGCVHRNIYTAVKKVEKRKGGRLVHSSDIGCYTLGYYDPINGIDTCIAMGASIGLANGIAKVDNRVTIAFLGDSTFFHSGLVGLINAIENDNELIVVIMNNDSTSMTGHQDHPGTGIKIDKTPGQKIDYVQLIQGLGVTRDKIYVPDANDFMELQFSFEQAIDQRGVRVIIPTSMCALTKVNLGKRGKIKFKKYYVNIIECCNEEYCLRDLGCSAMSMVDGKVVIDQDTCSGCSLCAQFCPHYAIQEKLN